MAKIKPEQDEKIKQKIAKHNNCNCEQEEECECEDCNCEENGCNCGEDCNCEDGKCTCGEDCTCDENDCECEECTCNEEDSKLKEYLDTMQRLQAEFDNYRKRNELIALKAKEEGVIQAVEKLLPVLDSFNAAEKHLSKEDYEQNLQPVKEQFKTSLGQLGVSKIDALGKPFDPNFHNAIVLGNDKEKESQIVLEVFQEGYMLKDKVIRHSLVKVNE